MSELTPETVREQIAELAAPLREQFHSVEQSLEAKLAEVAQLRALRTELLGALRVLDPSFRKPKATKNENGGMKSKQVAPATLQEMEAWLREHEEDFPEGFAASPLSRHLGFRWSQATASASLNILHDEGRLRLDHRGTGGGKFYKRVAG